MLQEVLCIDGQVKEILDLLDFEELQETLSSSGEEEVQSHKNKEVENVDNGEEKEAEKRPESPNLFSHLEEDEDGFFLL